MNYKYNTNTHTRMKLKKFNNYTAKKTFKSMCTCRVHTIEFERHILDDCLPNRSKNPVIFIDFIFHYIGHLLGPKIKENR